MRLPLFGLLALALSLLALPCRANSNPEFTELGNNTYTVTHVARTGFDRDTDHLKELALKDAADYCARLHKELKVLNTTTKKPHVMLTGFSYAKVTFKALDANDPELHAPVTAAEASGMPASAVVAAAPVAQTPTDSLYSDLMKLDDLRKRGILTEEEFQAQKKKLLGK